MENILIKTGKIKTLIAILLILLPGSWLMAQEIQLKAYVSRNPVTANDQFSYSVEITGKSTSLPDPKFPDLSAFFVLSGPNSSTNIQWVNGKMSSSKTNTFYLQPKKEGKFSIGSASVTYHGKTFSSNPISLTVQKAATASPAVAPSTPGKQRSVTDRANQGKNLFIKTLVSKRKAYIGEEILLTYKLYYRGNVRSYNIDKRPANAGFWTEDFKLPRQPVISSEIVNGVSYNVATLTKSALFPTQAGALSVEPMEITLEEVVQQRRNRRSLFDSFFDDPFGRTVQRKIVTKKVKINVLPIPEENRPPSFSGAVGRLHFVAAVDKKQVATNEAISLKLKLFGTGNIKLVQMPEVIIPPDIEKYDPKISFKTKMQNNMVSGSKTAEIILVPRLAGDYTIKPIHFSYFDPSVKRYQTISTRPIRLHILQGKTALATGGVHSSGLSKEEVTLLGRDIRFIKESSRFETRNYKSYTSVYFWAAILTILLVFFLFVLWDERRVKLLSDERLARKSRAGKVAAKQLMVARSHLGDDEDSAFYKALSQALQGFVRDKLNIELTEFSAANIRQVLSKRGIPEEDIREYQTVLEESDFNQFAGKRSGQQGRQELFDRAKVILTRLEKWI